jgi:hypothetical protein
MDWVMRCIGGGDEGTMATYLQALINVTKNEQGKEWEMNTRRSYHSYSCGVRYFRCHSSLIHQIVLLI